MVNDMKDKDYRCKGGFYHTEMCCDTCWNNHPEAEKGQMFLGTPKQKGIVEAVFLGEAISAGFTNDQAYFLLKIR